MAKQPQPVIAQKPRPTTTKFIHASRHFILNPENRVRHDLVDGYDILKTCRTLGVDLKPEGTILSLKEAGKRASEVMAKVALAKAKGLAKAPAKTPAKVPAGAKKGQDISSEHSTDVSAQQLAGHVKAMSRESPDGSAKHAPQGLSLIKK
jgi:hypothetical protein